MRVLFVEDSDRLRGVVSKALRKSGYAVDECGDGDEGLFLAESNPYDVAILDIMLPELDGLSMLKKLREGGNETPVIFLTAKGQVADRVLGFEAGADDYLVKPFALDELIARVGALCRRRFQQSSIVLKVADLEVDTLAKTVSRGGVPIQLKPKEFAMLELLMRRAGEVVSRTEIDESIYDHAFTAMSNVIDTAICAIRRKIAVTPDAQPLIHTRRGHGYVLKSEGG